MPSRKPARGKTTTSGLGHRHKLQRERLLRMLVDGSPCPLCGLPMFKQTQRLHADHSQPRAIHGPHVLADRIVHASCNMREGGRLRAALAGQVVDDSDRDLTVLAMAWP
jgi:hypothetical protein